MCGIFGSVFTPAHVDVNAALASMRHRGPDTSGVFRRPGVVLGHNRLSILDLSEAAAQPMTTPDQRVAVVFNGEIYNHHELRSELVARGCTFRSRSDTEVIVEGYAIWGENVVERLDGMFAVGIFDVTRRRLVLARDRTGKKPLFYTCDRDALRFASEAKAIFASGVAPEIDGGALPTLLAFGHTLPPRTVYRGLRELPPGHVLVLDEKSEPKVRRYWRAPTTQPKLAIGVDDATREVRRLVEAAVARRLEADVPLGAFLSGGIDSTIVVGVMSKLARGRVRTFSAGFPGHPGFDETQYARIAAKAFRTEHTELHVEPSGVDLVGALVRAADGPFGDESFIPTSLVAEKTRQHVTVALTGDGGDELFCGYTKFLTLEATERVPHRVREVAGRVAGRLRPGPADRGRWARVVRTAARAALDLPERMLAWHNYFAFELEDMLTEEALAAVDREDPFELNRAIARQSEGATVLSRVLDYNFETYLPCDLLVKADRTSMMHSLELRSPFLDTELIEFVTRLPDSFKRRGRTTKWILRKAFADLIPPEIAHRKKMGFGVPLDAWFRGELRSYLEEQLRNEARLHRWVRRGFVDRLLEEHRTGKADHGLRLWFLLTVEVWLKSLTAPVLRTGARDSVPMTRANHDLS